VAGARSSSTDEDEHVQAQPHSGLALKQTSLSRRYSRNSIRHHPRVPFPRRLGRAGPRFSALTRLIGPEETIWAN
jgi:hypothetical protein